MKEQIKSIVLNLGADVCGIASIDRFEAAPKGFHPTDIYAGCKSVIAFGKHYPNGLMHVSPRIVYNRMMYDINGLEIDRIAYFAALEIEKLGAIAVPVPSDSPYEFWDAERQEGRGILSMRHLGALAGIGALGKNTLLLNKDYGNTLGLGAILTDLELPSDALAEPVCIEGCRLCLENCPSKALNGQTTDQSRCRPNTYTTNARGFAIVECNTCRTICPRRFGMRKHP